MMFFHYSKYFSDVGYRTKYSSLGEGSPNNQSGEIYKLLMMKQNKASVIFKKTKSTNIG